MPDKVAIETRKVVARGRLDGQALQVAAGASGYLGSYQCQRNGTWPTLRSLAYDGDAVGTGYVTFKFRLNKQNTPYYFSSSQNSLGEEGKPVDVDQDLPCGALCEVYYEVSASLPSPVDLFSDGLVEEFDAPPF